MFAGEEHRGKLVGLMGNYDGNPANDKMDPSGYVYPPVSNTYGTDKQFGWSWEVGKENSLFTYFDGNSYETFRRPRLHRIQA